MNRQAITFFSLFSLILVLSVYYMMIPPIDNNKNINQDMEISLQEKLDAKRENDIQIQNDILASSASSSEQLNEALSQMDETTQHINLETLVKNKLIELGYKDVFCEIDEDIMKNHHTYLQELHSSADQSYLAEQENRRAQYLVPLQQIQL